MYVFVRTCVCVRVSVRVFECMRAYCVFVGISACVRASVHQCVCLRV